MQLWVIAKKEMTDYFIRPHSHLPVTLQNALQNF
jgi:hypothetical protein